MERKLAARSSPARVHTGDRVRIARGESTVEGHVLSVHPVRAGGWEVVVSAVEADGRNTRTWNVTVTPQRCPITVVRRAMDAAS